MEGREASERRPEGRALASQGTRPGSVGPILLCSHTLVNITSGCSSSSMDGPAPPPGDTHNEHMATDHEAQVLGEGAHEVHEGRAEVGGTCEHQALGTGEGKGREEGVSQRGRVGGPRMLKADAPTGLLSHPEAQDGLGQNPAHLYFGTHLSESGHQGLL